MTQTRKQSARRKIGPFLHTALVGLVLAAFAGTAAADDRVRRGGKGGGFDHQRDRGHSTQRWQGRGGDRHRQGHDRGRGFDGGSFVGGVVLGSLLTSSHHSSRVYSAPRRSHVYYGGLDYSTRSRFDRHWVDRRYSRPLTSSYGYLGSSFYAPVRVSRPASTVVYQTVLAPTPPARVSAIPAAAPARRFLLDLQGNCYELITDEAGNKLRVALEAEACEL